MDIFTYFVIYTVCVTKVLSKLENTCNSRNGNHDPKTFDLFSCAWCYHFLFSVKQSILHASDRNFYLSYSDRSRYLIPNITDEGNRTEICSTLTADECIRWQACCSSASECCKRQIAVSPGDNSSCKRTWDGWGCWHDAKPDTSVYLSCPSFLTFSIPSIQATKRCLKNGSWEERDGEAWTNYQPCLNFHELKTSVYISIACSAVSIVLLFPAIIIFLRYHSLRKQCRIRLHTHFFLALFMKEIVSMLWDILVTYDRLSTDTIYTTTLTRNPPWCRFLAFLRIYLTSCTYSMMFCEGFYLHQLLSNAFSPPSSLIGLTIFGWGIPLFAAVLYSIIRGLYSNESCWLENFKSTEWIFYTPNLGFILANTFFLCNIVRILLTQIQSHPNEPSNFRRAVKATFVLIPLFGVHLFVKIYRVPLSYKGGHEYERFTICLDNLQGFLIALLFCFFNNEVNGKLRRTWRRQISERLTSRGRRMTLTFNQTLSLRSDMDFKAHKVTTKDEEICLKLTANGIKDEHNSDNSIASV